MGLEPIVQIIHISDLHIVTEWADEANRTLQRLTYLERLRERLEESSWPFRKGIVNRLRRWEERLRHGTAPHDPQATEKFFEYIARRAASDEEWADQPTILLDTGDLTTYGDRASLWEGEVFLRQLRDVAGAELITMRGNHDEWPGDLPCFRPTAIPSHRARVRQEMAFWFNHPTVRSFSSRSGGAQVQLFTVTSVTSDFVRNSLALGHVAQDEMEAVFEQMTLSHRPHVPTLRLLALHHPVSHQPADKSALEMILLNQGSVAQILAEANRDDQRPAIHVVISGHTHVRFPDHPTDPWDRERPVTLPLRATECRHAPLAHGQCQLVAGSLSQVDVDDLRLWPHQAELLRFYWSQDAGQVVMKRALLARPGLGDFAPVPLPDRPDDKDYWEVVVFEF
jgi:3',5'-cyclic AMP phosphodiesterase CpdA